ncbi:phosphohistidine phosphatase SixA [Lentimicrobium saccharophilum]|uniref:Phosphohistidine phosphatase SixA n=1 Tax=Lentimicrobium saccharophilum TaxID=1678841 RepID=A0A0S7C0P4_9BACT|nr:histidine phosphatase family protein [Lentimicrobium saccharophilum]GAP43569.1 phosphohistidine phosphatase SixA [Lentimicrobium saccharophilum]
MKTLTLMRHAKSSWKDAVQSDLERPLLEKGLKRTRLVIDFLQGIDFNPEMILTSHAVRAMETARIMAHAFNVPDENLRIEKNIYTASAEEYFDQFFDIPRQVSHVLLVGHNPAITNFVNRFLQQKLDYLPTSGIVSISFETGQWEELALARHRLMLITYPKMLKSQD